MRPVERIRVLPELRAVQVERETQMAPAETWYFGTNYDLEGTAIPDRFVHVNAATAAWRLLRTRAAVLEVPEPLWVRFLPINSLLVMTWRISGFCRLKNRRARTFAIENNDAIAVVCGARRPPVLVRWLVVLLMGVFVRLFYERVVFGTPAAEAIYRRLPFFAGVESTTVLALPTASVSPLADTGRSSMAAVFVGQLSGRKGVDQLMRAWSRVEDECPEASVTIVGSGPLHERVTSWVREKPRSRRYVGQLPHEQVSDILRSSSVVVAPSRRDGRWREQIGLPIEEGLAVGLTIVTTTETGLADWLAEHRHLVIPAGSGDAELADAVVAALVHPLARDEVLQSLPAEDARITADRWLHREEG
ncbi:glycosyltransferase family 4 protein [Aeromicrobium endophyticum]|uniref:Glycosyltransferase n=1 Tax=Aeromicrobium endophyticum TaxID=2292704 RepID=A0A371PAQ1_9ACTN|nr:glycosyltransferase family 4 protein [Aeromicrobium endophyticum]REK73009.1 glycosyltransferase [Aeromicrobium endophyticum]